MRASDAALLRGESQRIVSRIAPQYGDLFQTTLARIEPAQWVLEWNLPFWLGKPFGLPASVTRALTVSNVLGLAALRLFDDLADNRMPARNRANSHALALLLEKNALDIYSNYFSANDPFWQAAARHMQNWHTATRRINTISQFDVQQLRLPDSAYARVVANLGAPLKINAIAVCRLTAREDALPDLEAMLDHSLIAAVLHDHVVDWESDIQERRQNFFVNSVRAGLPERAFARGLHARMIQAWLQSDAPRGYFQEILYHLDRAETISRARSLVRLTAYYRRFAREVRALYSARRTLYRVELGRAARRLFRSTSENIAVPGNIERPTEAAGHA